MQKFEKTVKIEESGESVDIYVVKPTNAIIAKADMHRAKIWNKCIRDGIIIKKELAIIMEERGIWNEAKSNKEDEIGKEIQQLEKRLYRGEKGKRPKVSDGQKVAIEMRNLRLKLRDLITERIGMEENTAESLSDNARFDYFVSSCTFYKEGDQKVYADIEDYSKRSSDEVAFAAASLLGDILYNLDSTFEVNLPENKWLKSFNLVNDDLSLINNEGDLVDTEGRKVNNSGYFLDDQDNRVDINGVPLAEDGNYIMVDYENDLTDNKPKKSKTTRSRKKSTTTKASSKKIEQIEEKAKEIEQTAEVITTES
jgi:hypothetical protein